MIICEGFYEMWSGLCRFLLGDEILRHFIAEIEMEFRAPDLNKQPSGHSISIIAKLVLIFQWWYHLSLANEAPIWSNKGDYLAIALLPVWTASKGRREGEVADSENNEQSFVARKKQFLSGVSISWIIEEILKSHACWIQWIEMRMSRYNTSLSPSSPSLSSLSYPGVG